MSTTITDPIEIACREIILEAGERLLHMNQMQIEEKGDSNNLVTSCDKATQEFLVEQFHKILPAATFLCEEEDMADTSGEYVFIIDPIDGTSNFIFGLNFSCIAVGLAKNKEMQWGIVYNPYTKELFEGCRGQGAYLNGKSISVSEKPLKNTIVSFGTSPYYPDYKKESFRLAEKIMDYSMDVRRLGSAELDICYAACGRYGLYFEMILSPWDFAAGSIILQEAGGCIVGFDGNPLPFGEKSGVIAGNRNTVHEFLSLIS